jgi:hypothetical protein
MGLRRIETDEHAIIHLGQIRNPEDAEAYFQDVLSSSTRNYIPAVDDNGEQGDAEGYLPDCEFQSVTRQP